MHEVQWPGSASKVGILTDSSLTQTDVFRELLKRDDWSVEFAHVVLDEPDGASIPPGCTVGGTVWLHLFLKKNHGVTVMHPLNCQV